MIDWAILAQATETAKVSYLEVLFLKCGAIGWLLWLINALTWALIIKYFLDIRRETFLPIAMTTQLQEMFENRQYREVLEATEEDPSYIGGIVNSALSEASFGYSAMERSLEEAAEERTTRMLRSIEWLNLIGNIGPMLGLMGTVWGMIGAFFTLASSDSMPKPSVLAGDIGVALVTTLLGLAVAIPALAAYAIMRNRVDALTSEAMVASQDLISNFRPGAQG